MRKATSWSGSRWEYERKLVKQIEVASLEVEGGHNKGYVKLLSTSNKKGSLDQFKGMNQIGDTGLRDQVNNHYLKIFGASLAVGAIGGIAEAGSGGVLTQSGTQTIQQGVGESLGQTSQRILDKFLNILPTVTIREGHRVKIYLSGDLAVPDYANHKMPSDL